MNKLKTLSILSLITVILFSCEVNKSDVAVSKHSENNKHIVEIKNHEEALVEMKAGNQRFLENKAVNTDYKSQIEHTKNDQHPHTMVLTCIDSRVPPEIIFDQGIGNIFVARVAGNIEEPNILGSMEFATELKGTKLIIVMGHNKCGAVTGAIDDAELGHLTHLVNQIKPAIVGNKDNREHMLDETTKANVRMTIKDILDRSQVISSLVKENEVKIIGAIYDVTTGEVSYLD